MVSATLNVVGWGTHVLLLCELRVGGWDELRRKSSRSYSSVEA